MNEQDFMTKARIIKETFNDNRTIKCYLPIQNLRLAEHIHQEGELFITENYEIIDLEFQFKDFTEDELVKYVELAEALYEKNSKRISIYVICPNTINICVREFEIKSEADFTIKLAAIEEDLSQIALDIIKSKLDNGETLDIEDIEILKILPLSCKKEERNYFRKECFKIINNYSY